MYNVCDLSHKASSYAKHMATSSEIEPLAQKERRILGFCISQSGYVEETISKIDHQRILPLMENESQGDGNEYPAIPLVIQNSNPKKSRFHLHLTSFTP